MILAVLDTNTLASGAVATTGPIAALTDAWRSGAVQVVVSPHILRELDRALHKPYFTNRLDRETRERFFALVQTIATILVISTPVPSVVTTRADNLVLATAKCAGVPFVVSGDRELQRLGRYRDVTVLSPRQFMVVLAGGMSG